MLFTKDRRAELSAGAALFSETYPSATPTLSSGVLLTVSPSTSE